MIDWQELLNVKQYRAFSDLDVDDSIHNQVDILVTYYTDCGLSIQDICTIATIFQMIQFDDKNGLEGDGQPKALRRHWYYWQKLFAIEFSQKAKGEDIQLTNWGKRWDGYFSQCYANLVDTGYVTYRDLWVKDASRMMHSFESELFQNANILLCVEKDSLFEDFAYIAEKLGCKAIYSGKGKSGKAAIEKLLDDHFPGVEFTKDNKLTVIVISDYDYDGEGVIGPTFPNQLARYVKHIRWGRLGILPYQAQGIMHEVAYQIKTNHRKSKEWAIDKGISTLICDNNCEDDDFYFGVNRSPCPTCGGKMSLANSMVHPFHGLEVEAIPISNYIFDLVQGVIGVFGLEYIIDRLRDECKPNLVDVALGLTDEILNNNQGYSDMLARLNQLRANIFTEIHNALQPKEEDFRDLEDDPTQQDYVTYIQNPYTRGPWRPFSVEARNQALTNWYQDDYQDTIDEMTEREF